ncbi:MAG TPA: acyltransferase, partial [Polyangia bacterium]
DAIVELKPGQIARECSDLGQHHEAGAGWFHRIGWSGVDLFFVLSGFLVTGLLLEEQARVGVADVRRFLIRRAFKIYPSFWAMIAVTLVLRSALQQPVDLRAVACEVLFIQNYGPSLWVSTWSLAVEEHFYIGLAVAFALLNRRRAAPAVDDVIRMVLVALIGVLALRCLTISIVPPRYKLTHWGTHVRLDALMFGALLAYVHHRAPRALATWVRDHRALIGTGSALMLALVFLLADRPPFLGTVGYTLTYLAYGGVLLLTVHQGSSAAPGRGPRALAWIGRHSYGIYLWHLVVSQLVLATIVGATFLPTWVRTLVGRPEIYLAASITIGVAMSKLVELPFLRLRDRFFPAPHRAPAKP